MLRNKRIGPEKIEKMKKFQTLDEDSFVTENTSFRFPPAKCQVIKIIENLEKILPGYLKIDNIPKKTTLESVMIRTN